MIGMQVFAYVDRKSLTHNDVFSIVRGIEEFNALLPLVRIHSHEMRSSGGTSTTTSTSTSNAATLMSYMSYMSYICHISLLFISITLVIRHSVLT